MGVIHGIKEFKKVNTETGGGKIFPDFKTIIEDSFAENDKVAVRYKMSGTHEGMFMGVAPTGKMLNGEG